MQSKLLVFRLCAMLCFSLIFYSAIGQQRTVMGNIKSPDNVPLGGVTVSVRGSNNSTQTDADGNFSIPVPNGRNTLVFSSVGYENQEVNIANKSNISLSLRTSTSTLNEVVVTGYSSQRKKDITGSVSVVNTKELVANPGSNVESLLQGRAAGVTVGTSGVPGAGSNVRIHGYSTFGNNEPLYVVDGARVGSISDLNPNEIETLQVLKDASSASIYGSAAAGGVIIITTKRGKVGAPKITYDTYYGIQSFNKGLDLLNTEEYGRYLFALAKNAGNVDAQGRVNNGQYGGPTGKSVDPIIPDFIYANGGDGSGKNGGIPSGDPSADPSRYKLDLNDVNGKGTYLIVPANKTGTDWLKVVIKQAQIQSHQITASGGTESSNYLFGLNYFNQDGIVVFTGYKRYSLRANTNFKVKNVVRIGENLQLNYIDKIGFNNQDEGNAISMAYRMQPIVPVYDIQGNFAGTRGSNLGNASNPYAQRYRNKDNKDRKIGIIGSVYMEADILKNLTFRSNLGMDFGNGSYYGFSVPSYENSEGRGGNGGFYEGVNYGYQLTWYNTLTFHKVFNGSHDIRALVGTEIVQFQGRGTNTNTSNFFLFDRNFWQGNSSLNTTPFGDSYEYLGRKYSPVIAQVNYAYRDRYLLSASFRRDGSSNTFGPNNKYGNFPAGSIGWRISEEPFFNKSRIFNDLKLRAGYGVLGNDNINEFGFVSSYVANKFDAFYPIDGSNTNSSPGLRHNAVGNPNVKWEQTATLNIGADATLFNKLNVVLDLYNRETIGLLFPKQLDPTVYGVQRPQPVNIGSMNNKGIDLSLGYKGNFARDFVYDANFTFSLYRNKVGVLADPFFEGNRFRIDPFNRSVTGRPLSSFYGYQIDGFFNDSTELATLDQKGKFIGGWRYKDISGPDGKPDGKITPEDRTWLGSPHPDFVTSLNLNIAYKNFDVSIFLYWKKGGKLANEVRYWTDFNTFQGNRTRRVLYNSWTPENHNALLPRLNGNDNTSGQVPVSYYIEPGGYLRMRNLMIGYTLPKNIMQRVHIDRLRFYVQAQNLFTITKYTGLDPEITTLNTGRGDYRRSQADKNLGVDAGNFPNPIMLTFGLNLGF
ncbi:MAG: TonB-dependent receptor [Flavisolibacter sp.]